MNLLRELKRKGSEYHMQLKRHKIYDDFDSEVWTSTIARRPFGIIIFFFFSLILFDKTIVPIIYLFITFIYLFLSKTYYIIPDLASIDNLDD